MSNATVIICTNPSLILKNGTTLDINEEYGLIWIHPDGYQKEGSFRLNLKLKMVDVQVGAQK